MTVVFEENGWQIVALNIGNVYARHGSTCQTYAHHYTDINRSYEVFKCGVCDTIVPSSIQCLVILHNWED